MISFAVPYPVHWGVAWSRTKSHQIAETWVADCGDPYMGDLMDTFRKPFYFSYLEKWFCRKANFITIPVESARPGYYPEFQQKIKIIPQGFNFVMTEQEGKQSVNSIPNFAYAGRFLKSIRDPNLLIQYLIKIDLPFKFFVYTDQPEILSEYCEVLKDKLLISGYIERDDLIREMSKMDFLINFDNNTSLNVPSKLIDYAIVNKPVLNIDKHFKIEDLLAFLHKDYSNRMTLPDPSLHHISNISQQFLSLL